MYVQKGSKKNIKNAKKTDLKSPSFFDMFRKKKNSSKKYEKAALKGNNENHEEFKIEEDENGELDFSALNKNKGLLLITLWKRGIPVWLRSILWPISIGNQLEVAL